MLVHLPGTIGHRYRWFPSMFVFHAVRCRGRRRYGPIEEDNGMCFWRSGMLVTVLGLVVGRRHSAIKTVASVTCDSISGRVVHIDGKLTVKNQEGCIFRPSITDRAIGTAGDIAAQHTRQ